MQKPFNDILIELELVPRAVRTAVITKRNGFPHGGSRSVWCLVHPAGIEPTTFSVGG